MEALRVENLSQNFGGVRALQDVSLSVEVGERRAIIGPNGAGKTTLLNAVSGEMVPTAGRVYILDREVTNLPIRDRVRLGMARSSQINNLFFHISVLDNVLLALQAVQPFRFQIHRSISKYGHLFTDAQELLQARGLWEKRDLITSDLCYGEQRQLEIALGLAQKPKLLLLDEATTGLTPSETSEVVESIRSLGRDITVILVSHNIDVVFAIADRITLLHLGQVMAEGTPAEIRANSEVKQIYFGDEDGREHATVR